jgi:hypothetical protein
MAPYLPYHAAGAPGGSLRRQPHRRPLMLVLLQLPGRLSCRPCRHRLPRPPPLQLRLRRPHPLRLPVRLRLMHPLQLRPLRLPGRAAPVARRRPRLQRLRALTPADGYGR